MPRAGRPSGMPQGQQNPQASPNTFMSNAPKKFGNIQNSIDTGIGKVQSQIGNMANRHFGSSPYSHLVPQLTHPMYGAGGGGPNKKTINHKDYFPDPNAEQGADVGPQSLGTYAPDINADQFQNENFKKQGVKGSNAPLGYGFGSGMMGMMGGGMGGMDPMMQMLMQLLGGGGMGGGPQVGN